MTKSPQPRHPRTAYFLPLLLCILTTLLLPPISGRCLDDALFEQHVTALKSDDIERNADIGRQELWKMAQDEPEKTSSLLEAALTRSRDRQQRKLIGSLLLRLYLDDLDERISKPSSEALNAAVQNLLNDRIPGNASRVSAALRATIYDEYPYVSHTETTQNKYVEMRDEVTSAVLRLMEMPDRKISVYAPVILTVHYRNQTVYHKKEFKPVEELAPKICRILIANLGGDKVNKNAMSAMWGLRILASYENPVAIEALKERLDAKNYQERQLAAYALSTAYCWYNPHSEEYRYNGQFNANTRFMFVWEKARADQAPARLIEVLAEALNSDDINWQGTGIALGNATNAFSFLLHLKEKRPMAILQKMETGKNPQGADRAKKILRFYAEYPVK